MSRINKLRGNRDKMKSCEYLRIYIRKGYYEKKQNKKELIDIKNVIAKIKKFSKRVNRQI